MFTFSNHETFVYIYNGVKTVGIYTKKHRELEIMQDHPELGIYAPRTIPARYNKRTKTLLVIFSDPEMGFEKAIKLTEKPTPCDGCVYATGEHLLPCAVNPFSFGEGCREYSN